MSKPGANDGSTVELGQVLPLPQGELADFKLLAIVAQVADLERRLTPSDFARLPSLRSLVEAARAVASELGYGDESRSGA